MKKAQFLKVRWAELSHVRMARQNGSGRLGPEEAHQPGPDSVVRPKGCFISIMSSVY